MVHAATLALHDQDIVQGRLLILVLKLVVDFEEKGVFNRDRGCLRELKINYALSTGSHCGITPPCFLSPLLHIVSPDRT